MAAPGGEIASRNALATTQDGFVEDCFGKDARNDTGWGWWRLLRKERSQ
jgi:hypothetical protein